MQAVLESGSGRDINRHKYSEEEAQEALKQPVVKALLDLCKFRNTHQAFMGQVRGPPSPPSHPSPPPTSSRCPETGAFFCAFQLCLAFLADFATYQASLLDCNLQALISVETSNDKQAVCTCYQSLVLTSHTMCELLVQLVHHAYVCMYVVIPV